jgi:hypothetical protein
LTDGNSNFRLLQLHATILVLRAKPSFVVSFSESRFESSPEIAPFAATDPNRFIRTTSSAEHYECCHRLVSFGRFIHSLSFLSLLCLWDEPQWAVVGDTFPVGCKFSDKIVYYEAFKDNPNLSHPVYQTELGIYSQHCGLDNVLMSWGHDEYLHHVVKDYLPPPALYMIRYHSCYPVHHEGDYGYLMNAHDRELFAWVNDFNQYDLYTKRDERMNVAELRPFYEELIAEYFPSELRW